MSPTKLHTVNALLPDAKAGAQKRITELYHTVQKPPLLSGISRTYQPRDEDGEQLPPESTRVQVEVDTAIDTITADVARLFDLQLAQDIGNSTARADVVVGGQVLLTGAPVTYLLFLAKRITDLRTLVDKLPVLDPADTWSWDDARGCYRTTPTETIRSRKVARVLTLAPATEKHPAQVQVVQEDQAAGTWTTVKLSGAVPAERRRNLLRRIDALLEAVKIARESANAVDVDVPTVGSRILSYLFAG